MATQYKKQPVQPKKRGQLHLALKFCILFLVAATAIIYSDKKGYFQPDQLNNHTARKWNSFYSFTKKNNVDIVLVGNSHLYAGCNPKNLSEALGCNCFVLASPGTTIGDTYYCLKEALTRTSPKIAIIETYTIGNAVNKKLTGGGLSDQYKSFNARKNFTQKLFSSFRLFSTDNILPAWSTTLRNHEFIFRDRDQLKYNIAAAKNPPKKDNRLYLGRFVAFTTGIEDDVMHKYDSLGAPVDGAKHLVNRETDRYIRKIITLCEKHNVMPLFVTIPMYDKHIKNYPEWHETVRKALAGYDCHWVDYQIPYDYTTFDRDCFENTYSGNQHMTYTGSLRTAYKIANYITDSMNVELPARYRDERWHAIFYGEEGYFENYPARRGDATHLPIAQDVRINQYHVKDCLLNKEPQRNVLYLKISKDNSEGVPQKTLLARVRGTYAGAPVITDVELYKSRDYNPPKHYLYMAALSKDVSVDEIIDITER